MKDTSMTEEQFDQLLQEMRDENPPSEDAAAARDRVWQRLSGGASACASFQPDITEYVAGRLSESRRMLLEDHFGRCVDCRHLLSDARGMHKVAVMPPPSRAQQPAWTRWALAAGVALGALYLGRGTIDRALAPSGPRATIESISGNLVQVSRALKSGDVLAEGEAVRTGAGSRAILRLADGSRVEMNQRTELAVLAAWSGETIRLNRGDVVVQAAKQRRGHLRVVTRDSVTSVKGTVFAVSSGAAGSLVSVVEGSVAVSGAGTQRVITAGQQAASNPALERVRVRDAISWSQDSEKYFTLIAEFSIIQKQLAAIPTPALRTQASLLPFIPASAGVYIAIPNLDGTIRQALNQVEMRARDNSVLNDWWSSDSGQRLKRTLDRVQAITPLLGEEVVFTISKDPTGHSIIPLMLAAIQPGRQDALRQAVERLVEDHPEKIPYQINQNLLLISDSAAHLADMAAQLGTGASSPFAAEIVSRYQSGVSWLAGIDVNTVGSAVQQSVEGRALGMSNMRYLFFQQNGGARDDNEATLSFQGSRTGIASWLAPAGSSGSAEYISPEAVAVLSGSSRNPRQAVDELLAILGQGSSLMTNLNQFESETGVSITNDLAASFGTDFTLAIERPSLPMPGWVAVAEVLSPSALDDSVRRLADSYNRKLTAEQASRQATLGQETVNGRIWNSIQTAGGSLTLYWTYDHGYMIASADRALATRAIAIHDSGSSLITSASFQQRFPVTSDIHHSGFLWFNSNGVLADLAGLVQSPALKSFLGSRDPLLVVLDGETERIHAASRTSLTQLILDLMLVRGARQAG